MSSTNCICCCCTTRSATIILAWLVLITTVTAMELCIYALTTMDLRYSYALKAIIIGLILSLFGEALLLGSFLYGIHTKRPSLMLPFLIINFIGIVLLFILFLASTFIGFLNAAESGLIVLVVGGLIFAIPCYIWNFFYSYYLELES
ncbi:uncharacterized protein [Periplaneta americana]